MNYQQLIHTLLKDGYDRVERDDRLLDVFPAQTREKGIELWEKWDQKNISFVRIHEPPEPKNVKYFSVPRRHVEQTLQNNEILSLAEYETNKETGKNEKE